MALNIFLCEDSAQPTPHETEANTIGALAAERGYADGFTASIAGRTVGTETELQANDVISFTTARKTGGQ